LRYSKLGCFLFSKIRTGSGVISIAEMMCKSPSFEVEMNLIEEHGVLV